MKSTKYFEKLLGTIETSCYYLYYYGVYQKFLIFQIRKATFFTYENYKYYER